MKVGDRVRVIESVIIYHHPEHRNEPFDIKGTEGTIRKIMDDWQGRPISPTLPINVQFALTKKKFIAHFKAEELELVTEE
ncbi:MAG: ferredoxin-thioredoxin reductase variable chain [Cyanobacteriota bacterium]|nr:ferredoxin-thioredoxin reductase variable chain [Cyanobacteriota bacterium]